MAHNTGKATKEIQQVLDKYNLTIGSKVSFPQYNILPDEIQLALKILLKHGMKIITELKPKK